MATFRVDVGYQYRIVFPLIAGCAQITDVTHTAGVAWRNIEVDYSLRGYNAEKFTAKVVKWTGNEFEKFEGCNVHVTIDEVTTDYQCDTNGEVSVYIPLGKEYSIAFDKIDDLYTYGEVYNYSFTANSPKRELLINYRDMNVGIFIIANDLTQYTKEQWIASGRPASDGKLIRIVTNTLAVSGNSFGVDIDSIANRTWYSEQKLIWCTSYPNVSLVPLGEREDGFDCTLSIIKNGKKLDISTPAALRCYNDIYMINNVRLQGFLGAAQQHRAIINNKEILNNILYLLRPSAIYDFDTFINVPKWTSNQLENSHAIHADKNIFGVGSDLQVNALKYVVPFYKI